MKVSIAFQGGGARVLELMAAVKACHAIEQAEAEFDIFRVSGASAGAIAAAMFATSCNIDQIIGHDDDIRKLVETSFPDKNLKKLNVAYKILRGKALYDEAKLREIICRIFKFGGVDAEKPVNQLKLPVGITNSQIRYQV